MKITNQKLIEDLVERTNANIASVEKMKDLSIDQLNKKASPESWSALECLEHLNRYGDFYLPEINKRLMSANEVAKATVFSSGVLGNYFAKSVAAKEKLNKMKTFKNMNPKGSKLGRDVIDTFLKQQAEILQILMQAQTVNLTRIKTGISISKFLKLRLGDSLRVLIYHNERHIVQALRACS